jgi:hypothetical protein
MSGTGRHVIQIGQCEFSGKVRKPVMLLEYEVACRTWWEEMRKPRRKGR